MDFYLNIGSDTPASVFSWIGTGRQFLTDLCLALASQSSHLTGDKVRTVRCFLSWVPEKFSNFHFYRHLATHYFDDGLVFNQKTQKILSTRGDFEYHYDW